jgi:hypothetical protein
VSGLSIGGGIAIAQKGLQMLGGAIKAIGPDLLAAGQASAVASSSFNALAASVGISSRAMLTEARTASRGLITDLDIMAASNKALLLGLPVTSQGFATLAQSATALGRAMGQDAKKSLDDLITGLGRGSAQILDNLGIVVNAEEAHKNYAASIGKTAAQLTEAEKKIAVYNAALASMGGNVERLGGIQLTLADRLQQVKVTWDNVYAAAGQALVQNPAIIAAFESLAESISATFGSDQASMVESFTDYLNRFALGAIQVAEWAVTAFHGIGLAVIQLAQVMAATNPITAFMKGLKEGLAQQAAMMKASFTVQMNGLTAAESKMKKAIEDERALAGAIKARGSAAAAAAGAGGGGKAGASGKNTDDAAWSFIQAGYKYGDAMAEATRKLNAMVADAIANGPASNLANAQAFLAMRNATVGIGSDLGPGIAKKIGADSWYQRGDAAVQKSSMNTAQALQNLANIASVSGSKLGKAIAGIAGGGAGLAGGLSSLSAAKGEKGLAGLLGKVGAYGQIASSVLSIGSSIFGLFKKKPKEPPPEPPKKATAEAWRNFTGEQQGKGTAGILAGVSGIGVSNAADMASQSSIALQTYWQVWRDKGPMAAAEAFKPIRDKMLETFKAAGASDADISAMLGPMSTQIDLAGNKAFAGAAEGVNGFADALASVANQQMPMTVDQFRAYEQQAVNGFNQMKQAALDQGLSMEEATRTAAMASGKYLTTLKDASSKYGIDLGGSEALFDEAAKAGVMLGSSSEERLIMSLDALTEALGGAPPKFEQAMTAGANRAGDRISEGAATGGVGAGATATDIGSAVAAKMGGNFDKLQAALANSFSMVLGRPIELTVNMDGTAIANGLADTMDRGGGERLRTAFEDA